MSETAASRSPLKIFVGVIKRTAWIALAILLLVYATENFTTSFRHLTFPHARSGIGLTILEYLDPHNAIRWSAACMLSLLALLAINRAFAGQLGIGPIDWVARGLGGLAFWGRRLVPIASIGLMIIFAMEYRYHFDSDAAAKVFAKEVKAADITNSGNYLFARSKNGETIHVAKITPDLVRALRKHVVPIGKNIKRQRELATPGFAPIAVLLLVFIYRAFVQRRIGGLRFETRGLGLGTSVIFGLTSLYVMLWLSAGQVGNEAQIMQWEIVEPGKNVGPSADEPSADTVLRGASAILWSSLSYVRGTHFQILIIVLVVCALLTTRGISVRLGFKDLDDIGRVGWVTLYFIAHLAAVIGIFFVAYKTAWTPFLVWLAAYVSAVVLCWSTAFPSERDID